jgi:hypothetical protein
MRALSTGATVSAVIVVKQTQFGYEAFYLGTAQSFNIFRGNA